MSLGRALKSLPTEAFFEEGDFRRKKIPILEGHLQPAVHDALRRIARLGLALRFGVAVLDIGEPWRRTIVALFPVVAVLHVAST